MMHTATYVKTRDDVKIIYKKEERETDGQRARERRALNE